MFNIWKQSWRNSGSSRTENEVNVNKENQSGATGDRPLTGSASAPLSASTVPLSESSFLTSKKHARAAPLAKETVDTSDSRPTKKVRNDSLVDVEKKDSLANYLPEVHGVSPVKPPVITREKSTIISQSYLDEVSERAQRVNSQFWPGLMYDYD